MIEERKIVIEFILSYDSLITNSSRDLLDLPTAISNSLFEV